MSRRLKTPSVLACTFWLLLAVMLLTLTLEAQFVAVDPGVRTGPAAAGGPMEGLTTKEQTFFNAGQAEFQQAQSVTGSIAGTEAGLGPRFNLNSCAGCHAQPAVGGSSPAMNPQVALATENGAANAVPFYMNANGPIREARFALDAHGNPDGGVTDVFSIAGRTDAPGCTPALLPQPADLLNSANIGAGRFLTFRIPTPVYGAGLVLFIDDSTIMANKAANAAAKAGLGISGHENRNGNDGTITRFGWKAQNKSLMLFAAEAYNVEQGVSNEVFNHERTNPGETSMPDACEFNAMPEDMSGANKSTGQFTAVSNMLSNVDEFALYMSFLAPPIPAPPTPSTMNGAALFSSVGCALCHTPTMATYRAASAALSQKPANLFSDLLVHHMGAGLADHITQGLAGGDEFRTAPLWGLGQRIFFLHDGRTTDLLAAIAAHNSSGSEASQVIANFNALTEAQKQDVLNFLRSL